MSEMRIIGMDGDTRMTWDGESEVECEEAKKTFKRLKKQGYLAFKVNRDGKKGEMIDEFDPQAEKIILAPPIAGG